MAIDPDPKPANIPDSDDGFAEAFNEFAAGKTPAPHPDDENEPEAPGGNGPEEEAEVPEEEEAPSEPAAEAEPAETATPGEAETEGASQPPSEEPAPDPWANLSDEQKALLAELTRERDEAIHRASSDANRVAALTRKLQTLSVAGAPPQEAPAPTEAQKALDGKIKQLREDYGEIAEPLIELIEVQKKELDTVRTTLAGLNEAQQAQVIAHETVALEQRHPDWRNIAQSGDFAGWLEVQPPNIQRLAQSWDARETSVVLTLFKAERAEATGQTQTETPPAPKPDAATGARREQQLEGSKTVRSRPAPAASGPPEDFDAAFKYFEEKRALASTHK